MAYSFDHFRRMQPPVGIQGAAGEISLDHFRRGQPVPAVFTGVSVTITAPIAVATAQPAAPLVKGDLANPNTFNYYRRDEPISWLHGEAPQERWFDFYRDAEPFVGVGMFAQQNATVVAPIAAATAANPTTLVQVKVTGVSAATAAGLTPALRTLVGVPVAIANAARAGMTADVTVQPQALGAPAVAPAPTLGVSLSGLVEAEQAAATGSAVAPGYSIAQPAPPAIANASVTAPTLSRGTTIAAPAAMATGQAASPALELRPVSVASIAIGNGTPWTPVVAPAATIAAATAAASAPNLLGVDSVIIIAPAARTTATSVPPHLNARIVIDRFDAPSPAPLFFDDPTPTPVG